MNHNKKIDFFNINNQKKEKLITTTTKHNLGQYFTTNEELKTKIYNFILNKPTNILEPSIGRGDLIEFIINKIPNITFDMYEIDTTIEILDDINKEQIIYGDFLKKKIMKTYKTIIGNPPFVKTKKGNLYINFIEKCVDLLENDGELIFIVPSDFFKLTKTSKLLNKMMLNGTFTHIFHPNNEKLFDDAFIDIIIFRYYKNASFEKKVIFNDKQLYIINSDGLITFNKNENKNNFRFKDYFDIFVGMVSGKEKVFKNKDFGNIDLLNGMNKTEKYIYIKNYPCDNEQINKFLFEHKKELINRCIRKFNENNWFEWGRNINIINKYIDEDCIYIYNLTRKTIIAFSGKINYFGGNLIMLKPKKKCNLVSIINYLNSDIFKNNFIFSGRFKIGHRQICNSYIPNEYL